MNMDQSKLKFVVAGLLLAMLMASMDNTIVVTAMGTIVGDLKGLDSFVWVISAYMVAEMAGMPIFGKLSDMYGRKIFFLMGMILFLLGSILCGISTNITELSIFRAMQGVGGGALIPIAFTIVFDIFPPEKRGKMGGIFGAVFGLSSIFGPLLGAFITDNLSWHWVFYINLPLGIIGFILVALFYKESSKHQKQKIDWFGAITLVGAVVCLMFALELGGKKYEWSSTEIISLFIGFIILFLAFIVIETKAKEPIISFKMFKNRLYAGSTLVGMFYGATFMAATTYIPIFIQGVHGGSATNSGLLLLPMMLSSTISAQAGGFLATKMSYRNVMFLSAIITIVGVCLLGTLGPETSRFLITIYMIIVGLGVGFSFSVLGMAAIHSFGVEQRGQASSTSNFMRSIGMTVGVSIYGTIQNNEFSDLLKESLKKLSTSMGNHYKTGIKVDPNGLLTEQTRKMMPPEILHRIIDALSTSIVHTFLWSLCPAVLAFVFIFIMGKERLVAHQTQPSGMMKETASTMKEEV
ncbi:MFS transporter [Bacillus ginsengihumi]|uniref:MFS transporter n=1 Tax=Heyndrickxia ginsengihumi TaxID=363870 RepID=A0A6M0P3E8_9BACI|nr:MDR family MFS transporter [Heyndrickxia ginsengihumi]MBE6183310.1 DHA2 family efflux MFS transporter permease subunit [Bacillus sp. (in: firmicutes)]MCM3022275.1 MFS transporter [Heyndrickxia ginsengihumi]NEY18509.1 MFS transporter [Heyndrickxia ginsengihumi]